jgi:hypothetical protein
MIPRVNERIIVRHVKNDTSCCDSNLDCPGVTPPDGYTVLVREVAKRTLPYGTQYELTGGDINESYWINPRCIYNVKHLGIIRRIYGEK